MRLIVLPCDPDSPGGYNRVVLEDLERVGPSLGDFVVIYLEAGRAARTGMAVIPRPRRGSWRQALNVIRGLHMSEVNAGELARVIGDRVFDDIFCGDIIFYRALRKLFPRKRISVRLHNLFSLAMSRWRWRGEPIDLHFWLTLRLTSRLEREVCADPLADVIFINERERRFASLHWPDRRFDLWGANYVVAPVVRAPSTARIIYFGGTASHQSVGVSRFISDSLAKLRTRHPELEFHLWGNGTQRFDDPAHGVHGHGFHDGAGLPMDGDGLFVIPDLLGGGIKIKTGDALRQGLAFITTPFGAEGYEFERIPGRMVHELDSWHLAIDEYFRLLGKW